MQLPFNAMLHVDTAVPKRDQLNKDVKSPLETVVGVLWMASFFVVRVLPVPWLLYVYTRTVLMQSGGCGLSAAELLVGGLTVPIPIGLNLFWFWLMVKKVQRMLSRKSASKKQ